MSYSISSILILFYDEINSFSMIQKTLLLALIFITIFRRRLSSNSRYRDLNNRLTQSGKQKYIHNPIYTLTTDFIYRIYRHIKYYLFHYLIPEQRVLQAAIHGDFLNDFSDDFSNNDDFGVYPYIPAFQNNNNNEDNVYVSINNDELYKRASILSINKDNLWMSIEYLSLIDIMNLSASCHDIHSFITSDFFWEQLWKLHFQGMWNHPSIKLIREKREIFWDPRQNYDAPLSGWRVFYREFAVSWVDWYVELV